MSMKSAKTRQITMEDINALLAELDELDSCYPCLIEDVQVNLMDEGYREAFVDTDGYEATAAWYRQCLRQARGIVDAGEGNPAIDLGQSYSGQ